MLNDKRCKQILTITESQWDSNHYQVFFDDYTFSNFSKSMKNFLTHSSLSEWNNGKWPKNSDGLFKRVAATMVSSLDSNVTLYFFDDGTAADLAVNTKQWNIHPRKVEDLSWSFANWQVKSYTTFFNSAIHEIVNIKVQHPTSNPIYDILADGKEQVTIYVWVQIRDKTTGKFIELSDDGSVIGSGGTFSLVTLYDYWQGPLPKVGSFLDIDKLNTPDFSTQWQVSRRKMVQTSATGAPLNNGQVEISNWGFVDGWNRYTYYVTSTEVNQEKRLCARVGSVPDYVYSCSSPFDEYAKIRASKVN